jgi:hypothetical protein
MRLRTLLYCFLLVGACALFAGCGTDDPDNLSSRPWDSPKGWEHGLPASINEGR